MLSRVCADMILRNVVADELATYAFNGTDEEAAIFTSKKVPADFSNEVLAGNLVKPWVRCQELSSARRTGTRTRRAHTLTCRVIVTGPQDYDDERIYAIARKISRVIDRGSGSDPNHDDMDVQSIFAELPVDGGVDDDGFSRIVVNVEAIVYEPVC